MVGAVIVAAGKGLRMEAETPKQYMVVAGLPVLCHTLRRLDASNCIDVIALVVPKNDHARCREEILPQAAIETPVHVVSGGPYRQDSVGSGLDAIGPGDDNDVVVVHDGVRPTVLPRDIAACVRVAAITGACILGQPVADTLKQVAPGQRIVSTVDRRMVWRAQTPQVFKRRVIAAAHREAHLKGLLATDDSVLVEALGVIVSILPAGNANIKITTPQDLELAAAMLSTPNL